MLAHAAPGRMNASTERCRHDTTELLVILERAVRLMRSDAAGVNPTACTIQRHDVDRGSLPSRRAIVAPVT